MVLFDDPRRPLPRHLFQNRPFHRRLQRLREWSSQMVAVAAVVAEAVRHVTGVGNGARDVALHRSGGVVAAICGEGAANEPRLATAKGRL